MVSPDVFMLHWACGHLPSPTAPPLPSYTRHVSTSPPAATGMWTLSSPHHPLSAAPAPPLVPCRLLCCTVPHHHPTPWLSLASQKEGQGRKQKPEGGGTQILWLLLLQLHWWGGNSVQLGVLGSQANPLWAACSQWASSWTALVWSYFLLSTWIWLVWGQLKLHFSEKVFSHAYTCVHTYTQCHLAVKSRSITEFWVIVNIVTRLFLVYSKTCFLEILSNSKSTMWNDVNIFLWAIYY